MSKQNLPAKSGRLPELDLLRFLAAAGVVAYHLSYSPATFGTVSAPELGVLPEISRFGYLGVEAFFMISGFVILWSSEARTPVEFLLSRAARLFPSFWICVLLTALVIRATGHDPSLGWETVVVNLTMVPGIFDVPYVDGVYWTLFVELKFYLLIFLILCTRTMSRIEWWLMAWLAASVGCALGLLPKAVASLVVHPFAPYFISGCLCYLVRSRGVSLLRLAMLAISCVLCTRHALAQQLEFMHARADLVVATFAVVMHVLMLGIALRPGLLPNSPLWYVLGAMTYPLYLLHNQIGRALAELIPSGWPDVLVVLLPLIVVFAAAWVMSLYVERRLCGKVNRELHRIAVRFGLIKAVPVSA